MLHIYGRTLCLTNVPGAGLDRRTLSNVIRLAGWPRLAWRDRLWQVNLPICFHVIFTLACNSKALQNHLRCSGVLSLAVTSFAHASWCNCTQLRVSECSWSGNKEKCGGGAYDRMELRKSRLETRTRLRVITTVIQKNELNSTLKNCICNVHNILQNYWNE